MTRSKPQALLSPPDAHDFGEKDPLLPHTPDFRGVDTLTEGLSPYPTTETSRHHAKRWGMLAFAFLTQFYYLTQSTIYYSVLWPYLQAVDLDATESFFGLILSLSSVSTVIASVVLGYLTNHMQQTRFPLLLGTTIVALGNLGTMFAGSFSTGARWWLLAFRIITGFGLGSTAVIFSYIAMASTSEERDKAVTIRSAVGSGAFLIGPGFASIFSSLGYPGTVWGPLHIDMYTAPALLGVIVAVPIMLFLAFIFEEHWVAVDASQMKRGKKDEVVTSNLANYDTLPVIVCIVVRFALRFTTSYDQSVGSPLTMTMFNWTPQQAIRYNGIIQSATGALDFVGNMVVGGIVLKYVTYRYLIPFGLLSFMLSFAISFPYPGILPPIIDVSDPLGGDNSTCSYNWCAYTTRIYLWQYILSYVFVFAAFCIAYTPVNILYTKLFGPRKQGVFQGMYLASSYCAASVAPVAVTTIFENYGPRAAWGLGASLNAAVLLLVLFSFRRLVTYDERMEALREAYLKV